MNRNKIQCYFTVWPLNRVWEITKYSRVRAWSDLARNILTVEYKN